MDYTNSRTQFCFQYICAHRLPLKTKVISDTMVPALIQMLINSIRRRYKHFKIRIKQFNYHLLYYYH
jgi:hypothetical protein